MTLAIGATRLLDMYLEGPRDEDQAVGGQVLHSRGIDAHQVDDVTSGSPNVITHDEGFLIHCRDQSRADTHASQEAEVKVL